MTIAAFIIHLSRAAERRPQVEALRAGLPVPAETLEAVDGRALTEAEIAAVYRRGLHAPRYPFALGRSEIACFLSHRKAWQAIVDRGLDAGFIVEDDVALTEAFPAAWRAAVDHLEPDGFIRFAFRDRERGREIHRDDTVRVLVPSPVGLGTVAQLVAREAARRLLDATRQFDRSVDTLLQMSWVTGVRPLSVVPGGVREISSELGGSTVQNRKSLPDKLAHEILRPIYRMRVRARSNRS